MKRLTMTVVIGVLVAACASAKAASFQGLGDLPGGGFVSWAHDASADGSVVVGWSWSASGYEAFRWESGEMVGLGDLPGGIFESRAWGVSADGSVVVGVGNFDLWAESPWEAFRWTSGGGMVGLGDLPGGGFCSYATGVSADGSVVVGLDAPSTGREAFRWIDLNGNGLADPNEKLDYHPEFGLGDLPGGLFYSMAADVSPDGSVVVGYGESASGVEAFRWTSGGGMVGLGDLPGGSFYSDAWGVSADGSVVVGFGTSASDWEWEAFRWTDLNGNGLVDPNEKLDYHPEFGLGYLSGGDLYSIASGVSSDGSVVVGESGSASDVDAFIWDAANGIRSLQDVLENDFGLDLTGWILESATGISDDGSTIVGIGINPSGDTEAWIATVPKPVVTAEIDIKPGSCPNPLNVKSKGVLPVAILGSEDFDVNAIDVASIRLAGVAPIRSSFEDVATPVADGNECACATEGPDGYTDLALKFKTQEIVNALGEVADGEVLTLTLTAVLLDERAIEGSDCILVIGKFKPFNRADVNKDGMVNTVDFAILAENWLESTVVGD